MEVNIEQLPKSTAKMTVKVPAKDVQDTYQKVVTDLAKNAEMPGFRKGSAPKEMVKDRLDPNELANQVINDLLQTFYTQAIKENNLAPVSNPRVEVKAFDPNQDFEFTATIPLKPDVKMGDYKKDLKQLHDKLEDSARQLNAKKLAEGEKIEEQSVHLSVNEVVGALNKASEVEIPDMLIEDETERMLSRLVQQAQSINLSLEQYLKAQNKTSDELKGEYQQTAEKNLKSEFVLAHLVKAENVVVDDDEIEQAALASGDESALERLKNPMEKWYIKSILEKNKLISKLIEEAAGHDHQHSKEQ
jgi:FKBP-type peptidyl-prolyl cis-trans isomerase (trigger factor)